MASELIDAAKEAALLLREAGAFLHNHHAAHEKFFAMADRIDAAIAAERGPVWTPNAKPGEPEPGGRDDGV